MTSNLTKKMRFETWTIPNRDEIGNHSQGSTSGLASSTHGYRDVTTMSYPRLITYSCCLLQHVNASPTPSRLVPAGTRILDAPGILIYYAEVEPSLLLLSFSRSPVVVSNLLSIPV